MRNGRKKGYEKVRCSLGCLTRRQPPPAQQTGGLGGIGDAPSKFHLLASNVYGSLFDLESLQCFGISVKGIASAAGAILALWQETDWSYNLFFTNNTDEALLSYGEIVILDIFCLYWRCYLESQLRQDKSFCERQGTPLPWDHQKDEMKSRRKWRPQV